MSRTLTKQDIIRVLADKYRLQYSDTRRVVQGVLDMIVEALLQGSKVELRNFGVFEVVDRKARVARNPKKHYEVRIPPRKVVRFRQGKIMDEKITTASMQGQITPRTSEGTNEPPRVSGEGSP